MPRMLGSTWGGAALTVFNPHDPRGTLLTLVLGVRAGLGTLNIRSLRDSGITWLALDGVDVVRMQRRAGHENVATTIAYVKQAEDVAGTLGKPFGPLPMSLVKAATDEDVRAKDWPKLSVESSKGRKNKPKLAERAGFESENMLENKAFSANSRDEERPRDDVSTRMLAGVRPSETSLASSEMDAPKTPIVDTATAPAHQGEVHGDPRATVASEGARDGADAAATPDAGARVGEAPARTIRDELADLVGRAVREGDLELASRLIEVVRAQRPAVAAGVVDLAAERARRGEK